MPDQDPHAPNLAPPSASPIVERRGMDAAVIALIKQLHEDFESTHANVHETFVSAHTREHELTDMAHERALMEMQKFLEERDYRYKERWEASGHKVDTAVHTIEKSVEAAFGSSEKAISVAAVSIEKRADATYVQVGQLATQLTLLMPRQEAEQRFGSTATQLTDLRDRVKGLEALSQGGKEAVTERRQSNAAIFAAIGIGIGIVTFLMPLLVYLATKG